jgi:8-oxo-dGTP pyrophosphatase MutT (NUDIX family)
VTEVKVSIVDVYALRPSDRGYDILCLRRAPNTIRAGTWETIHGKIDAGEKPVAAARRELLEETGLVPDRFYNLSRVESFYQHQTDEIALIPVFAAVVARTAVVKLSEEHAEFAWLTAPEGAARRFAWPREIRAMNDALALLKGGTAGGLEDVLLVDG